MNFKALALTALAATTIGAGAAQAGPQFRPAYQGVNGELICPANYKLYDGGCRKVEPGVLPAKARHEATVACKNMKMATTYRDRQGLTNFAVDLLSATGPYVDIGINYEGACAALGVHGVWF